MKYHFVYRTHNLVNGKEYTGKHSTDVLNDGYFGSGTTITKAIKKYGKENFAVEILSFHDTEQDALDEESRIVDEEYILREDTYNNTLGGLGAWAGTVIVKDRYGNTMQVSKADPRYLSGELVSIRCGQVNVKDKDGNIFSVSVDDPRYKSGEWVHHTKGNKIENSNMKEMIVVKDSFGEVFHVRKDDGRLRLGELSKILSGIVTVIDKNGNQFQTTVDDPLYISGELKHRMVGMVTVKDKDGNTMQVSVDDPRYLSGELVGVCKGIPKNYKTLICPHCGKEGRGPNMSRYHFNNCKSIQVSPL